MSAMGWIVAAYLFGAVMLLLFDDRLSWDELLGLAAWPVAVPVALVWRAWRRWRTRCRTCGRRYHDRAMMLRHVAREHGEPS